ncbi:MAG: hypothetical protein JWP11_1743, partial [Frankiales bacterium]|nr:hypothetical protein [Frankiales bacterium]
MSRRALIAALSCAALTGSALTGLALTSGSQTAAPRASASPDQRFLSLTGDTPAAEDETRGTAGAPAAPAA